MKVSTQYLTMLSCFFKSFLYFFCGSSGILSVFSPSLFNLCLSVSSIRLYRQNWFIKKNKTFRVIGENWLNSFSFNSPIRILCWYLIAISCIITNEAGVFIRLHTLSLIPISVFAPNDPVMKLVCGTFFLLFDLPLILYFEESFYLFL